MLCRLQIVSYLQRCYNTSIDYDNYYQLTNSIVYKVIYYESRESMNRLKAQQKQSVNFQNYGKQNALEQSEAKIQYLKDEINELPIVEEFRSAQYEANDLLQMMVKTMEDRLNEYNKKEHNE